jgi:FkbM family methyltransferase
MSSRFIFDQPHYDALNVAREATIKQLLESLQENLELRTAVDVGCGLGHFSVFLRGLGFEVLALDGRLDNINEAMRRSPGVDFRVADAEDAAIRSLGKFDLVLCLGLLYHLENPFAVIRNLFAMAGKVAILEGMCLPGDEPVLAVRDEGPTEDQGLRHVALYPTENGLVKLLYRSGFPFVYRFRIKPRHADYHESAVRKQVRTILVAATVPVISEMLVSAAEPVTDPDPWTIKTSFAALNWTIRNAMARGSRFLRKPRNEQARSIFFRWVRLFPMIPVPVRLPFGGWWLARNDFLGAALFYDGFENTERAFVERFLQPGMTVLDIGAHHGYYTLLASRKVGPQGLVLAVEASPRERGRLRTHLRINRCKNVVVESRALGEVEGTAELYLVRGTETGCNSLRKPDVDQRTEVLKVPIERLDRVIQDHRINRVDFIKLDVEGAELSVLKGATQLLSCEPRPVILAEVQDIRTKPWGYPAREVVRYLSSANYFWFQPLPDGRIRKMNAERSEYDGNFVAIPQERLVSFSRMIAEADEDAPLPDYRGASLAS